jgi:adenylate cyclase
MIGAKSSMIIAATVAIFTINSCGGQAPHPVTMLQPNDQTKTRQECDAEIKTAKATPIFKEQLLKKALRVYAGEHVLERVLQQGEAAFSHEIKTAKLTMMFIEVAAIHGQSKKPLTAQQVTNVMSSSLAAVIECVNRHKGVVDSFIGDTVFAYWGLNGEAGQEIKASRCALDCIASLAELSQKNELAGLPTIRTRIGIDTGNVVVGNIGSDQRMKFAVLGDHVNTASSLTGMVGSYPDTKVLITQFTREGLDDSFAPQFVGKINIKGRDGAVSLFTF